MLKVQGLSKGFGGQTLFEDLSFQMTKGELLSLVGRNGSGKSTLLKILMGEETPDSGTIELPRDYQLGYLQQTISFTQETLREEAALALPKEERDTPYRVEAILSGLGFKEEDFDKSPTSFSGGYQLRIQLAKTLAKEPDCLLLDEPTNYLDIVSIRWLERFLKNWRGECILISHDRTFLDSVATHTMGLHRKKLFRIKGRTREFFDYVLQNEEVHEKTRLKLEKKKEHYEDYIRRFGAKATKAKQAQSRRKSIERLPSLEKLAAIDDLQFHFNASPFTGKRLLNIKDVSFHYPEMETPLIQNFSLEIEPGDRIAIIGKNGRGKSTLLKLMNQEIKPTKGKVTYSKNVSVGYFGQTNIQKLNPSLSIEEEIQLSNPTLNTNEIKRICGIMMFPGNVAEKKIQVLSGGEKSRVLLGKILASSCNLLLLDEPSNHLDLESVEAFLEALEDFPGSIVIISHEEEILKRIPDKLVICHEGKQNLFLGDYDYFLDKIGWNEDNTKKRKEKKGNKQQMKQQKAEIIKERSRALSPIKKEIATLEKSINSLEKELASLQDKLEDAIEGGDNPKVATLSHEIGEKQKTCDFTYRDLEKQYELLEKTSALFDKKIQELE